MRLSESQVRVLLAASQRKDGIVALPPQIRGQAARRLVSRLLDEGLVVEIRARRSWPVWRRDGRGRTRALRITKKGRAAITFAQGVRSALPGLLGQPHSPQRREPTPTSGAAHSSPTSKQTLILRMLQQGATMLALMQATGWQAHSLRGFLAGVVRKKLRLPLTSSGRGKQRIYRIEQATPRRQSGKGKE